MEQNRWASLPSFISSEVTVPSLPCLNVQLIRGKMELEVFQFHSIEVSNSSPPLVEAINLRNRSMPPKIFRRRKERLIKVQRKVGTVLFIYHRFKLS